jgi:hypothetical protein
MSKCVIGIVVHSKYDYFPWDAISFVQSLPNEQAEAQHFLEEWVPLPVQSNPHEMELVKI